MNGVRRGMGSLALCVACAVPGDGSDAPAETGGASGETTADSSEDTGAAEPTAPTIFVRANPDMTNAPFVDVGPASGTVVVRVLREGSLVREYAPVHDAGTTAWLWGLHPDTTYEAEAVATVGTQDAVSERVEFTTGSLPPGTLAPTVTVHDPERAHEGLVAWSTVTEPAKDIVYIAIDPAGDVVWYHDLGPYGGESYSGDVAHAPGGRLMIYTLEGARILEPWGETILEVRGEFHHHVEALPNGNYLFLKRRIEVLDVSALGGPVEVKVDGLVEVTPAGIPVVEWWGSDHLDTQRFPSALSTDPNAQGQYDWTHANAAVYDPVNQQVLLSMRHQHWVVGIDWPAGTVAWRLGPGGDFTLLNGGLGDWFYGQHQPELQTDGTMLLFDNGNERPGPMEYSRGVQLTFNVQAGTAAILWDRRLQPISPALGDADRLDNGNVLLVAGAVRDPGTPRIVEVTPDDAAEIVWEVEVPRTYRATHIETHRGVWP